jgi:hypothetical protein
MERRIYFIAASLLAFAAAFPAPASATTVLQADDRGCWGLEVRNDSTERKQITVTVALQDSATRSTWPVILEPSQSVFRPIRSLATACLDAGDIHVQGETSSRFAETGEIGVERYEDPQSEKIMESWLESQQQIREEAENERANEMLLRTHTISLQAAQRAREQVEREMAARQRASAADERLRALRSQHPRCIINEDADLSPCVEAERRIRLDEIAEAQEKEAEQKRIDQQKLDELRKAELERGKASYMARANDDPCWAVAEFPRFYPEVHIPGENPARAATIDQLHAWLGAMKTKCNASQATIKPPPGEMQFDRSISFKNYLLLGLVEMNHVPGWENSRWVGFTGSNPGIAVLLVTRDSDDAIAAQLRSGRLSTCHQFSAEEKARISAQIATVEASIAASKSKGERPAVLGDAQAYLKLQHQFMSIAPGIPAYTCKVNF